VALLALGYAWAAPTTLACLLLFHLPMWLLRQTRPRTSGELARGSGPVTPGSRFWRWYARGVCWPCTSADTSRRIWCSDRCEAMSILTTGSYLFGLERLG